MLLTNQLFSDMFATEEPGDAARGPRFLCILSLSRPKFPAHPPLLFAELPRPSHVICLTSKETQPEEQPNKNPEVPSLHFLTNNPEFILIYVQISPLEVLMPVL